MGIFYRNIIRPILFWLTEDDAEKAHDWAMFVLQALRQYPQYRRKIKRYAEIIDSRLDQQVFGLWFRNPIGLAAGFDTNGEIISGLSALGFGFIEIGTVTLKKEIGSFRPCMFRLPQEKAMINNKCFRNEGAEKARSNLLTLHERNMPIGINIGKSSKTPLENAGQDYKETLNILYGLADYFVFNLSCVNFPELCQLQKGYNLEKIVKPCVDLRKEICERDYPWRHKPFLVKISLNLSRQVLDEIIRVSLKYGIDGIVAGNTIPASEGLDPNISEPFFDRRGWLAQAGLSGKPLKEKALKTIEYIFSQTKDLPIIGCGGIFAAQDAYEMLSVGASLIQVFTGLIYEGPFLVRRINRGLLKVFEKKNIAHITQIRSSRINDEVVKQCHIIRRRGCQRHP